MIPEKQISITQFRNAIKKLPYDEPKNNSKTWYKTQKEHWLGWLKGYEGPGAYGRKNWNRDARFVYNHVVCPDMLMYLIKTLPIYPGLVASSEENVNNGKSEMERSGAIRKVVPWEIIYQTIWGNEKPTIVDRLFTSKQPRPK